MRGGLWAAVVGGRAQAPPSPPLHTRTATRCNPKYAVCVVSTMVECLQDTLHNLYCLKNTGGTVVLHVVNHVMLLLQFGQSKPRSTKDVPIAPATVNDNHAALNVWSALMAFLCLLCRSNSAAATVPIVPPKPLGAARGGAQSAKLFQPSAPAAAAANAQAASAAHSSGTAADSANSMAVPAMSAGNHAAGGSPTQARLSNPYAEIPGARVRGDAAQHSTAQRNLFSLAQQQQQQQKTDSKSGTVASARPAAAKQNAQAAPHLVAAQPNTDSTQDLVTTYSSLNHDRVYPYAGFEATQAVSYTASSNSTDHFDTDAATTTAEVHAESHRDTTQVSSSFDDMTELQL